MSASSRWAANIDHIESRSLTGVSLIKIYFKPGTDANAALSNIANLAMADLRRLPPGTLPPVVLGMDASSQPVCLVTLKGQGLNETQLKDLAQFQVRNQISNVQGASVPQPYGGLTGRFRSMSIRLSSRPTISALTTSSSQSTARTLSCPRATCASAAKTTTSTPIVSFPMQNR